MTRPKITIDTSYDNETLIFRIEKGQYNLTFKRRLAKEDTFKPKTHFNFSLPIKKTFIFLGIFTALISMFLLIKKDKETYLSEPFISQKNTLLIVADHYMVTDKLRGCFSTYLGINNIAELEKYNNENSEVKLNLEDLPWRLKWLRLKFTI